MSVYVRELHEYQNPEVAARLDSLKKAQELVEQRAQLIYPQIEKALGASFHKVGSIRKVTFPPPARARRRRPLP